MVRIHPDPPIEGRLWGSHRGGVAQLGERVLCKHEVIGSIPFTSTIQIRVSGDQEGLGGGSRKVHW